MACDLNTDLGINLYPPLGSIFGSYLLSFDLIALAFGCEQPESIVFHFSSLVNMMVGFPLFNGHKQNCLLRSRCSL